ncbi:RNA-binding domain-containing protein [Hymenopellis radicata]|nr:RNA-binding domain-containing protein [Hymenopellis radicata]
MSDESSTTPPRKVLYLGNLPFNMGEDDIRHELQDFGVMTNVHKGTDPATGRPSGWAMVEFETEDAAASVVRDHLAQPFVFGGRTANIDYAKKQSVSPGGPRTRGDKAPTSTLFMGGLSFQASEQDVYEAFSEFGSVKRVSIGRSQDGTPRGFAHVEFFELDSATAAFDAAIDNPIAIQGRPVVLDYQAPRPPRAQTSNREREW